MPPRVTVGLPVYRPGSIDIAFATLRDQTFRDFEVVVVDHRYEKRHREVLDLATAYGLNVLHVPEHRRNGKYALVGAAWNTAIMLAQGEIFLMMPDYAYADPGWIARHVQLHDLWENVYVIAPFLYLALPPVVTRQGEPVTVPPPEVAASLPNAVVDQPGDEFGELTIFPTLFHPAMVEGLEVWPYHLQCDRSRPAKASQMASREYQIHFRNESVRRKILLEMDGLDEHLDRGKSHLDFEFARRIAQQTRMRLVFEMENWCQMMNPRTLFPTMTILGSGRWAYKTCERYALSTTGIIATNPYNFQERMAQIQSWRTADVIDVQALEIPDEVYYG
jgi:hypothetical protein